MTVQRSYKHLFIPLPPFNKINTLIIFLKFAHDLIAELQKQGFIIGPNSFVLHSFLNCLLQSTQIELFPMRVQSYVFDEDILDSLVVIQFVVFLEHDLDKIDDVISWNSLLDKVIIKSAIFLS